MSADSDAEILLATIARMNPRGAPATARWTELWLASGLSMERAREARQRLLATGDLTYEPSPRAEPPYLIPKTTKGAR